MSEKQTDWVTPVAVIGGGTALAVGAYFMLKGKKTVKPGDKLKVTFKFEYRGSGGAYLLRVALGNTVAMFFSEEESARIEYPISLGASPDWVKITQVVDYEVPSALGENTHDAEFSLRYTDGSMVSGQRVFADNIVNMG
jgi:hypothetical protein